MDKHEKYVGSARSPILALRIEIAENNISLEIALFASPSQQCYSQRKTEDTLDCYVDRISLTVGDPTSVQYMPVTY